MPTMAATLRSIPDTEAAIGWSGPHSIVVDRPAGKAGGAGLGFNGGQLLALAIGGCLCNDLHYVAHAMGVRLTSIAVDVTVTFEGDPLLATSAETRIAITVAEDAADPEEVIRRAAAISTVGNSLARGVPITVAAARQP